MIGAKNVFFLGIEKLAGLEIQGQAAMGTAVLVNKYGTALADRHQAYRPVIAGEIKADRARIGDIFKRAKTMLSHGFAITA